MYQDKIPKAEIDRIKNDNRVSPYKTVFEKNNLSPLTFEPIELTIDVCEIARDILENRNDEEILIISKAIKSIHEQGRDFALALLRNDKSRESIYLSEGRELYFLSHYYDLSTVDVKQLTWSEMFAALALMQCAELSISAAQVYDDTPLSQALKKSGEMFPFIMQSEIADSIARAECIFDNSKVLKASGSAGGSSKAKYIEPLKKEVITRYLSKYTDFTNKKAGEIIEAELLEEKSELLLLSESEEKNLLFSKWIGFFKNGELKIPITI